MEYSNYVLYLLACLGLSFLIGIERQSRRRFAGLRTTILLSVGSFLYVSFTFLVGNYEMTRIAAQVVSGMGFLGAGVIIKDGFKVRGLTTAATLWCDAAIGVLCAAGFIKEAVAGTLVILFSNVVLRYVNSIINKNSREKYISEMYRINVKTTKETGKIIKQEIEKFILSNSEYISVDKINIENDKLANISYDFSITKNKSKKLDKLIKTLDDTYDLISINEEKITEEAFEEAEDEL